MLDATGAEIREGDLVAYAEMARGTYTSKSPAVSLGIVLSVQSRKWPKIQRIETSGSRNAPVRSVDPAKILVVPMSEAAYDRMTH